MIYLETRVEHTINRAIGIYKYGVFIVIQTPATDTVTEVVPASRRARNLKVCGHVNIVSWSL